MKGKNVLYLTVLVIFLALLTVPTALYFTVGEVPAPYLSEKRAPAPFPQADDRFFRGLEQWYDDRLPYRLTLTDLGNRIRQSVEEPYRQGLFQTISRALTPAWYRAPEYSGRAGGEYLAPLQAGYTVYGRDQWLFYTGEDNLAYFTHENTLSEETMQAWKQVWQELEAVCESRGIRLIVLTAPNKEQVYEEEMPAFYRQDQPSRQLLFRDYMQDSGVTYLYPLEEMRRVSALYPTYYVQDTHWNLFGAYVGARAVLEAAGIPALPPEETDFFSEIRFGGDLSEACGYYAPYDTYDIRYRPEITAVTQYYEDDRIQISQSDSPNDSLAVIVGDSYCSAIQKYFAREFRETAMCYRDLLDHELFLPHLLRLGRGDVLIMMSVERYDERNVNTAAAVIQRLRSTETEE